jgi:outer membrane protein assembly factor BamB
MQLGAEGPFLSSPAVAHGRVYLGSSDSGFLCVGTPGSEQARKVWAGFLGGPGNPGSIDGRLLSRRGALLWRYPGTEQESEDPTIVTAPAACVGESLFVPIAGGARSGLACLKIDPDARETLAKHWFFETSRGVSLSPAATEDIVLFVDGNVGDTNRFLHCIDVPSGEEMWNAQVASRASGEFVLKYANSADKDCILIQDETGVLSCLDMQGTVCWREPVGRIVGAPAWSDSIIVLSIAEPPALAAVDCGRGKPLWRVDVSAPPRTAPVIRDTNIYFGTAGGIEVRSLIDGRHLWHTKTGEVQNALSFGFQYMCYTNSNSELLVLDSATGRVKATLPDAIPNVPPLITRDSVLYASTGTLNRYIFSEDRSRRWMSVSWLGEITSPVIAADSRVYFATDKRALVCAGQWR